MQVLFVNIYMLLKRFKFSIHTIIGVDSFQKPNTWCEKVPKKICAPDFCEMVPGDEQCVDKTIQSTIVRPEEVCDLQPSKQCRSVKALSNWEPF